ncbi:GNAT family N-acetyltransferase [Labrys wisconsinensis]|uniref:N-acetyltransferase YhbS n=1 Tax=Labrys wisconsinensis TaxID=425677 RepID=A0ABU0J667_9HYPH|nr:GNAT family N-acetyltransferase [Labrys wisconsinensis]MDQ0469749.1 putative N-acetyltransferase YhbS [Labrys wisconsinensis]
MQRIDSVGEILVRVARPDDEAAVDRLLAASFPRLSAKAYAPTELARALPVMTKANPRLLASGSYFVAEALDGLLVGAGGWTRERPGTGEIEDGLAHVRHFAVDADWGGRGIGRSLFGRCRDTARDSGIARFECYATLNAEPFYAALGFSSVRRLEIMLAAATPLPSVVMTFSL